MFAVLSSHFEWLIAGALAAALTYSGTAAIHAFLLIWVGPSHGDLDILPLCAILSTSCLIAMPLINWSSTLRNLGSHDGSRQGARSIIIFWAIWITLACATLLGRFLVGEGFVAYNVSIAKTIACVPPTTTMNYAAGQSPYWPTPSPRFHVYTEWISDNWCMDPCTQGPFYWPIAIFRSASDLQTLSHKDFQNAFQFLYGMGFYAFYVKIVSFTGLFVLLQGLWAMCFGPKTPRQCRDIIFRCLTNAKMPVIHSHQQGNISRYRGGWQRVLAKYLAIFAYIWAVISSIICVILFVITIIAMEVLLSKFPQSESPEHVGSWSPWAATGLLVAAALLSKVPHKPIRKMFNSSFRALKRISDRINTIVITVRRFMTRNKDSKQRQHAPTEPRTRDPVGVAKSNCLRALSKTVKELLGSYGNTVTDEWKSLVAFWRDPDCAETTIA